MNAIHANRLFTVTATVAVVAAMYATPAFAQSRASQWLPAGEGTPTDEYSAVHSDKTRAERKAETLDARRKGELAPLGLGLYKLNMSQQTAVVGSTKTRAERKAETQEAAARHQLMPAGEVASPAKS
jgi:hypothetical protein